MVDRITVARRDMETTADSIHFHVTVDLAALCEGVFELVEGLVILTLLNFIHVRRGPRFDSIGLLHFLTGITTTVQ